VRSYNSVCKALPCASVAILAIGLFLSADLASSSELPIHYGDFAGTNLAFLDVTEDSATSDDPMFGKPKVSGDALLCVPQGVAAYSKTGGVDFRDGQLTTTLVADAGHGIHQLTLSEYGDYSLLGTGTAATEVYAGLVPTLSILEVDGEALGAPIIVALSANANYDLASSKGIAQPWSLSVQFDIDDILADNDIEGTATLLTLTFDNTLFAASETNTVAFIAKKMVVIEPATSPVPEPSSVALLGIAAAVVFVGRSWRKRKV